MAKQFLGLDTHRNVDLGLKSCCPETNLDEHVSRDTGERREMLWMLQRLRPWSVSWMLQKAGEPAGKRKRALAPSGAEPAINVENFQLGGSSSSSAAPAGTPAEPSERAMWLKAMAGFGQSAKRKPS